MNQSSTHFLTRWIAPRCHNQRKFSIISSVIVLFLGRHMIQSIRRVNSVILSFAAKLIRVWGSAVWLQRWTLVTDWMERSIKTTDYWNGFQNQNYTSLKRISTGLMGRRVDSNELNWIALHQSALLKVSRMGNFFPAFWFHDRFVQSANPNLWSAVVAPWTAKRGWSTPDPTAAPKILEGWMGI